MLTIADKDKFVNDGPFFEKYPDTYPLVTHYERRDQHDKLIESWERFDDGRMHDVTKRDILREKIVEAQETLAELERRSNNDA